MSQPSWRLKVARAEQHLSDVQGLFTDYISQHPYRAELVRPSNRHPTRWSFILDITQEPDPSLSVVYGDFLFNMRSALDHIAVTLAPGNRKYKASFPILSKDPATETDSAKREALNSATKGMTAGAVAVIEWEQPYNLSKRGATPSGPGAVDFLHALSAMENADKHRQLVLLTTMLTNPILTIRCTANNVTTVQLTRTPHVKAGAELINWQEFTPGCRYDEVDVQVVGTPHVTAKIGGHDGYEVSGSTNDVGSWVVVRVNRILTALEPFV